VSASATIVRPTEATKALSTNWTSKQSYFLLAALTVLCLLPFFGRAFHIDDPLFVWTAQQIAKHPLDPYGFNVLWDNYSQPMSEVTKNPPLACYYAAAIGSIAGWSERALHLGFLFPALALILGTYRLASRFTRFPLLAAAATLLTPSVMVSATSVMCDTMMLAFWMWAVIFWIEGLDDGKQLCLAASGLLIAVAALTKYFGISLVPLLAAYSLLRRRRLGAWAFHLLIPVAALGAYQIWTAIHYGHAMFSQAVVFSHVEQGVNGRVSLIASALVGASFLGGCALSVALVSLFIWRWAKVATCLLAGAFLTYAFVHGWVGLGHYAIVVQETFREGWTSPAAQMTIAVAAGVAILALGVSELRNWRDCNSLFLAFWVFGTFIFAAFLNWSVNARSIMPLIPAAAILAARGLERIEPQGNSQLQRRLALALVFSGIVSFWITKADSDAANSARQAAEIIHQQSQGENGAIWFEGHWGFQYYMQLWGAKPLDFLNSETKAGDVVVIPNINALPFPMPSPQFVASSALLDLKLQQPVFTMRWRKGAGFYSSFYGFLPFAFAAPNGEQYFILTLAMPWKTHITRTAEK